MNLYFDGEINLDRRFIFNSIHFLDDVTCQNQFVHSIFQTKNNHLIIESNIGSVAEHIKTKQSFVSCDRNG